MRARHSTCIAAGLPPDSPELEEEEQAKKEEDINICKVHMDLNVADPLTKPLPRAKHDQHQNFMGVTFITM